MSVNWMPGGVYWALATLASDYTLEIPLHRLARELRAAERPPPATRVCVPVRRRQPLSHSVRAARTIRDAGMRPIVPLSAGELSDLHAADRTFGVLADAGAREVTAVWPDSADVVDVLDDLARVISIGRLRGRGISGISVAGGLAGNVPQFSADLLRAFDSVYDAGRVNDVDVTLLAPSMQAVESVVEWERVLSAAGNRIPIRARIPGIAQNPARRAVPMLLGLAAAVDEDPECLITGVQLKLRGSLAKTSVFAHEVCKGNFVVEDTENGYQFSLLPARRSKEGRPDD